MMVFVQGELPVEGSTRGLLASQLVGVGGVDVRVVLMSMLVLAVWVVGSGGGRGGW